MTGCSASDSLRMLARRYHDERCQNRLAAASASAWVASSRSSVAAHDGHERGGRPVGEDVAPVERLGRRPHRLRPEPERLALVRRQAVRRAVAREDRDDRDVLAELAEAGDEAAARERDVVRDGARRRRGSWPAEYTDRRPAAPRPRPAQPSKPAGADERDEDAGARPGARSSRCRGGSTTVRIWRSRGPTGMTSRAPSASWSRSACGTAGAAAVTMIPSHGAPLGSPRLPSPTRISTSSPSPSVGQAIARGRRARSGVALDRRHAAAERREDRRLVAGAGADLEDPVARVASRGARSSARPCTAG